MTEVETKRKLKVLNLYAGIGGNRKLWKNVNVTAVEINPKIAEIYAEFFPLDNVIVTDAHQYLLEHYKEYDFIWSSPPCPSHSRTNEFLHYKGIIRYPDMSLYQEILFLRKFFKGLWVVENVIPYYKPLISPQYSGRHCFWSNFNISNIKQETQIGTFNRKTSKSSQIKANIMYLNPNREWLGFDLRHLKINAYDKRQILRNCVNPNLGLHVFNMGFREKQEVLIELKQSLSDTKEKTKDEM